MSDKIETIKVKSDNDYGYKVINLCDKKEEDEFYKEDEIQKTNQKKSK